MTNCNLTSMMMMLADCPAVCMRVRVRVCVCVGFCVSLGTICNERGLIAGCALCGVPREQTRPLVVGNMKRWATIDCSILTCYMRIAKDCVCPQNQLLCSWSTEPSPKCVFCSWLLTGNTGAIVWFEAGPLSLLSIISSLCCRCRNVGYVVSAES